MGTHEHTAQPAKGRTAHEDRGTRDSTNQRGSTGQVKRLRIITILAAVVASGQADATLVASKAECLSTCAPQIVDACGGFRRAKYNRCRLKLVRQCRRFGPDTVCP